VNAPVKNILESVSIGHIIEGKEIYRQMKEGRGVLECFGENAYGYTTYYLYKSPENIIYCVCCYYSQGINYKYSVIEDISIFDSFSGI
jgi:hypothetical protein